MIRNVAVVGAIGLLAAALAWRMTGAEPRQAATDAVPANTLTLAQVAAGPEEPTSKAPPGTCAGVASPGASNVEAKIRRALSSAITLEIGSESLEDFALRLAAMLQIDVVLDAKELEADNGSQKQVKLHVAGVSAKAALEMALGQLDLDWAVRHEVLWITTAEAAHNLLETKVYPVTDLVAGSSPDDDAPHGSQGRMIDLITSSIAPGTWDEVGGVGAICQYNVGVHHMLVVSQTRNVHETIADLLAQLRAAARTTPLEADAPPATQPTDSAPKTRSTGETPPTAEASPNVKSSSVERPDGELDSIVTANNRFACNLFDQVAQQADPDKPGNLLISPYGVWSCLGLVFRGARGETAAQIAKALNFVHGAEETQAQQAALRQRLTGASQGSTMLRIAERLWTQRGAGLEKLATAGGGSFPLGEVDFRQPQLAYRTINQWVAQATNGRIAELIQPDSLNADSRFIVASAVYFHAPWQKAFQAAATKPARFHAFDRVVETPIMELTADCGHANVGDLQILEKTYAGGKLSMMIVLPPQGAERFRRLEAELSAVRVAGWVAKVRQQKVNVRLPKFKIAFAADLRASLKKLGMVQMFDPTSDLFGPAADGQPLYIAGVFQRTWIDVNEEGTEAAAASAFHGAAGAIEQVKRFEADHPFLFLIRHRASGAILFLGRVTDPSLS